MYSVNFSKGNKKTLDKKFYQNFSHNNVGKNFIEIYKELNNVPTNKTKNTTIKKSISKT